MASPVLASVVLMLMLLGCKAAAIEKQDDERDIESLRALFAGDYEQPDYNQFSEYDKRYKEEVRGLEEPESKRSLVRQERCSGLAQSCSSTTRCCGTLDCYYSGGFSLSAYGVCAECFAPGQSCQRDVQCCGGFICHKGNRMHINGVCGAKRMRGADCHDNDQCISNSCNIRWYQDATGSGGTCN